MINLKQYFQNLITLYLPKNSVLLIEKNNDFCLKVYNKIIGEESRLNKPAKEIKIIIPRETMEDYLVAPELSKQIFDDKLKEYIKTKVENFNPNHDTKKYQLPPVETWVVPFGMTY
jgi:hypothetical protein